MMLEQKLLEILCCPKCKGPLKLEPEETGFICETCKLRYLIKNGIPNFLIDEARPQDG
jgi:uncharacterized protein